MTLRTPLLLAAALASVAGTAAAEGRIELDAAAGYRFGGGMDVTYGDQEGRLSLDGAPAFTAIVGARVQPNGFVFLNYSRQSTTLRYRSDDFATTGSTGMSTEYLQFGGNLEFRRGRLEPYLGLSIGTTRFAATDLGGDNWRFSLALDGGVKIRLLPFLHLRALMRMPVTIVTGESAVFCVSGNCIAAFSGTPVVQGEIHGGAGITF